MDFHQAYNYKFFLAAVVLFCSDSLALQCKTQTAAADYKCKIKPSQKEISIKYRYKKGQESSVSLDYLKNIKGPYAREFFNLKAMTSKKYLRKNCKLFGLIGKCEHTKLSFCNNTLTASHSVTYGLFKKDRYKRLMTFNRKAKAGSYTYLRKTPKASPGHQLESYKVDFADCKLIKEY